MSFCSFWWRTMKPPAYGRSCVCRQTNELNGIHTDVALSPPKGADVDFGGINELD